MTPKQDQRQEDSCVPRTRPQDLSHHLGPRLLSYLLDIDVKSAEACDDELSNELEGSSRGLALATLKKARDDVESVEYGDDISISRAEIWTTWFMQRSGHESVMATRLHECSVGRKDERGATDTVEGCLAQIVQDLYAGLVIYSRTEDKAKAKTPWGYWCFQHPLKREFDRLVMQDSDLRHLFLGSNETPKFTGWNTRSTGLSGTNDLLLFAGNIIGSGLKIAQFSGDPLTVDGIVAGALMSVAMIRLSLQGEDVSIPVRVGFSGILLPDGCNTIEMTGGIIRATREEDRYFWCGTPLDSSGGASMRTADGQITKISHHGDIVLELDVPYTISLDRSDDEQWWLPGKMATLARINEAVENLRLGLLLSKPSDRYTIVQSWTSIADPMDPWNGLSYANESAFFSLRPAQLGEVELGEWVRWANLVDDHRTSSVSVSIRRMLMASSERSNPEDILVDAVMVWENLFGCDFDTTKKITGALAVLLSPEGGRSSEKFDRQKSYKRIYGLRSRVVHGVPGLDLMEVGDGAQEAVDVSISALREIFGEQHYLLAIDSSDKRGEKLRYKGEARN